MTCVARDGTSKTSRPNRLLRRVAVGTALFAPIGCEANLHQVIDASWRHETRALAPRDPAALPPAPLPDVKAPLTVADAQSDKKDWSMSLDEALRISLDNAKAIRVLTGLSATNSGRTIYDAAIAHTAIDQQQARFDPTIRQNNTFAGTATPRAGFGGGQVFEASRGTSFRSDLGLNKTNVTGGTAGLGWVENPSRVNNNGGGIGNVLNPQNNSNFELSYTQPLLQGAGFAFNTAPIVLARLDTERSYFQFKDSVQELVRGTIEAYWNLVFARLDVWARQIQLEQSEEALNREEARIKAGLANFRDGAQARVTYYRFRANLVAARATVLAREGALRNIIGLPPSDDRYIVPVSAPTNRRLGRDWEKILRLAEQRRPDIVELKLILEADQVRRLQAENFALPRLDATSSYRWNGLSGELPTGQRVSTDPGQFGDWSVGINFSVPLGLREGRARVRQQELIIVRDKANLDQGLHAVAHDLAVTVRELENDYEQYLAFKETRVAALDNLKVQIEEFRAGRGIYLNVLQALNDWGDAVSSEARALTSYNVSLATLERQTGTILETHGLVFMEERFTAAGPWGLPGHEREYPLSVRPSGSPTQYPATQEPGENAFDLKKPDIRPEEKKGLPPLPKFGDDPKKPDIRPEEKKGGIPPKPKFGEDRPGELPPVPKPVAELNSVFR